MKKEINRYSDSDLAGFKVLIEEKLKRTKSELNYYQEQIFNITKAASEDHDDWSEGVMGTSDLELLNNMIQKQRTILQKLKTALTRIQNKTYGVCEVTGKLIEKQQLLAVPTLTKSLEMVKK